MQKAEIMAYHGWGFDASCWKPLENLIPGHISWINFDRGYFGEPKNPSFSHSDATKIIITHSFGLHLCNDVMIKKADVLVIFGGFLTFYPYAAQFRRRSKWMLKQMVEGFRDQPHQVLEAFYKNVFKPNEAPMASRKEINKPLLLDDLKMLGTCEMHDLNLKKEAKVCIFHGAHDAIVPKLKGRELYDTCLEQAQYFEIKHAGHALPFTHSEKCRALMHSNILSN